MEEDHGSQMLSGLVEQNHDNIFTGLVWNLKNKGNTDFHKVEFVQLGELYIFSLYICFLLFEVKMILLVYF